MPGEDIGRERARILAFLAGGEASLAVSAGGRGTVLLDSSGRGTIGCRLETLRSLCADGLVRRENGKVMARSDPAQAAARPGPGREIETASITVDGVAQEVQFNAAESPLTLLARRRVRDGKPFIDACEFAAGERLRADYTRGQIMPRLGANWVASVASGRRGGGRGGVADLTDAALSARLRVERALEDVGPELSGVLVDVCCFLKGLEVVETERGWPARSAKVVLKAALRALARHYDPAAGAKPPARMLHWGADDYRPALG
ncbi:MAG: hypothetical protein JNL61_21955 [Rhizobiaceae bacterium]|nr:hypothetical protein [Rhizobiaceae bacterium]